MAGKNSLTQGLFDIRTLPGYTRPPPGNKQRRDKQQHPAAQDDLQLKATCDNVRGSQAELADQLIPAEHPLVHSDAAADDPASGSWVMTEEDAWQYWDQHGSSARQSFFFCARTEDTSGRAPAPSYDLVVIGEAEALRRREYVTISPRELFLVSHGKPTETLPSADWRRLKAAFLHLRKLSFWRHYYCRKYFSLWSRAVQRLRFERMRARLAAGLFRAKPAFCSQLSAMQGLLHQLTQVDTCGEAKQHCSLADFKVRQECWRLQQAEPAIGRLVADLVKAAEVTCNAVEQAALAAKASIRDPSELTDRIGIDLYAASTKARAKSMWVVKQEKIAKARNYHAALADAGMLPRFLRLLDLLLCEGLAAMVGNSCQAAAAALSLNQTSSASEEGAASSTRGTLICTIGFNEGGAARLVPGQDEWTAALTHQLVQGSLELACAVPTIASLPAFEPYALPDVECTPADAVASATSAVQASLAELQSIVQGSFSTAKQVLAQFEPQQEVHKFLMLVWDGDIYVAEQREHLDLARTRDDLSRLLCWQAGLAAMPAGVEAGRLYLDAEPLRSTLTPLLAAAADQVVQLLLEQGREASRQQLEELLRRLQVLAARPTELEDWPGWASEAQHVADERDSTLAGAAMVDDIYAPLAQAEVKPPTADAVRLDDLHEAVSRLDAELAASQAYMAEERPRQVAALAAAAAVLQEEAVLLEDSLKHGMYMDPHAASAEVLADLDLLAAHLKQMEGRATNLQGLQAALGVHESSFSEVTAALREQQRRVAAWTLLSDMHDLQASWSSASTPEQSYSSRREGSGGDSRESELLPLEDRLAGLLRGGQQDAVLQHVQALLWQCKTMTSSGSVV